MIRKFFALVWGRRLPEPVVCRIKQWVFLKTTTAGVTVLSVEDARTVARKLAEVCGDHDAEPTFTPPKAGPSLYTAAMTPSAN